MHQDNPASTGDISSDNSLPYKHNPASSLRTSLAPKPARFSNGPAADINLSANSITCLEQTDI